MIIFVIKLHNLLEAIKNVKKILFKNNNFKMLKLLKKNCNRSNLNITKILKY